MEKRIKSMSEAKAQLVLAALSNGKTLNQICGGRLNGRYPSGEKITDYRLYQNYCADHPDFSREAQALLAENMKASNARKGALRRNLTHCKYGHPFSGGNLYLSPGRKERKCWACMTRNGNTRRRMSEQQARRVVEALNDGKMPTSPLQANRPISSTIGLCFYSDRSIRSSIGLLCVCLPRTQKYIMQRRLLAGLKF
jgi:hypothetical protein